MAFLKSAAVAALVIASGLAAQAQDFDGFYVGGGLAWSDGDAGTDQPSSGNAMGDPSGPSGFAVAGYNKSYGNLIVGVEGDLSFGEVDGTSLCTNSAWACEAAIEHSATLRGRVGTVAAGNFLFASLGYSAAKVEMATSTAGRIYSDSHTLFGWTVGVGAERPLPNNWNLRGEVLYTDYNGADFQTDVRYPEMGVSVTTLRVGVSRKF